MDYVRWRISDAAAEAALDAKRFKGCARLLGVDEGAALLLACQADGDLRAAEMAEMAEMAGPVDESAEAIEMVGTVLGNAAIFATVVNFIERATGSRFSHSSIATLEGVVSRLREAAEWPAKAIEAFFGMILRKLGIHASSLRQSGALLGVGAVVLFFLGVGIAHFPSEMEGGSWLLSLTGLLGKAVELVAIGKAVLTAVSRQVALVPVLA